MGRSGDFTHLQSEPPSNLDDYGKEGSIATAHAPVRPHPLPRRCPPVDAVQSARKERLRLIWYPIRIDLGISLFSDLRDRRSNLCGSLGTALP
jgi:hypothetical protein